MVWVSGPNSFFTYGIQLFGEGDGTPLQYSCLENPMDRGAWWAAVHGASKSRTRLSDFPFTFHFHALEKEMATHSSVLAWRIPGTVEPGGLPSMGSHGVGHDWSDLAAAAAADSCSGTTCWIETIFSPLNCPGILVKSTDHKCIGLFLGLVLSHWSSVLMPVPWCPEYCVFVAGFEIGRVRCPNLFSLQDCFWLFQVAWISMEF